MTFTEHGRETFSILSYKEPLLDLLGGLDQADYHFVAPTPSTHARVIGRKGRAKDLRDVFGWSLPFEAGLLDAPLLQALRAAHMLEPVEEGLLRSCLRVSRLDGRLFLHSAYPTCQTDAVFLGPDSYRFARLIHAEMKTAPPPGRIVDLGAGAGVGGLVAAARSPDADVHLLDLNPLALRLARANAVFAGLRVQTHEGDVGAHELEGVDLAVANPPFMLDSDGRTYRDGGDMHGARLSLDWTLHTAPRLAPGGRIVLYTGAAIVEGNDGLKAALEAELPPLGCGLRYEELDPDIFGEDLDQPGYEEVERIAAVGAVVTRLA